MVDMTADAFAIRAWSGQDLLLTHPRGCRHKFGVRGFEPYFMPIEERATTHTGRSKLGALDEEWRKISRKYACYSLCRHPLESNFSRLTNAKPI